MPQMKMDQAALDAIVERMLAPADFFTQYWCKRPLYTPGAGRDCAGCYGVEDFLVDMAATQKSPHLVIGVRNGERSYTYLATVEEVRRAVELGDVAPMRISLTWHEPNIPERWRWMRALFGTICRAACMIYMSPSRSENVDLFLAGPTSRLGMHYDSSHTFTLQLYGERKWVVEDAVRLEEKLAAGRSPDFDPEKEVALQEPAQEITLRPGDAL